MSDDLLARLESATGPDRELDARICIELGLSKDNVMVGVDGWCINSETNPNPYRSPAYTASIDAALTLVGDNDWRVEDHPLAGPCAVVGDNDAYAPTPALALCIAALRARKEEK